MKRVILFRFHDHTALCKNRLRLLKIFNPGVPIYGLCGAETEVFDKMQKALKTEMNHVYALAERPALWRWKNGDLAVREWFKEIGKDVPFDMLHIIEWDLVLFDSLDGLCAHIPMDGMGITAPVLFKQIESRWAYWVNQPSWRKEWAALLDSARLKFGYHQEPYASHFTGTCFPRRFLERYSEIEIPEVCHDEMRVPLFAQIFNLKMYDTGFQKKWFDEKEYAFFNCEKIRIDPTTLKAELANPAGCRVFHPYQEMMVFDVAFWLLYLRHLARRWKKGADRKRKTCSVSR